MGAQVRPSTVELGEHNHRGCAGGRRRRGRNYRESVLPDTVPAYAGKPVHSRTSFDDKLFR
jgi:hypothetical protein